MNTVKNTKRAMTAFFQLAACINGKVLVAFLVSHGYAPVWSLDNVKHLANTIGADVARAQLETILKTAADALAAERAVKLEAARNAWVAGDPRAFDAINW